MAAMIQNGRQPNQKSRYLSFWISYLSDLSGLIKVFGPRNTMPNIIILSNDFLEVFEVFLISIVSYFGKIV